MFHSIKRGKRKQTNFYSILHFIIELFLDSVKMCLSPMMAGKSPILLHPKKGNPTLKISSFIWYVSRTIFHHGNLQPSFHTMGLFLASCFFFLLHSDLSITLNPPIECQESCYVWLPAQAFKETFSSLPIPSSFFSPDWMQMMMKSESESHSVLSNSLWPHIVYGILQARILEWVAFPFSRVSSQPRDRTQVSCIKGRFFTSLATRKAQVYWSGWPIPSPADLPNPGIKLGSPALQANSLQTELSDDDRHWHNEWEESVNRFLEKSQSRDS